MIGAGSSYNSSVARVDKKCCVMFNLVTIIEQAASGDTVAQCRDAFYDILNYCGDDV